MDRMPSFDTPCCVMLSSPSLGEGVSKHDQHGYSG